MFPLLIQNIGRTGFSKRQVNLQELSLLTLEKGVTRGHALEVIMCTVTLQGPKQLNNYD